MTNPRLPQLEALARHLADLRDGVHDGVAGRGDKERSFARTVDLLDPVARQALAEVDEQLLHGTGTVTASGVVRSSDGGTEASWTLHWPEQQRRGLPGVTLQAHFERSFHHPHLRGTTVGEWPLNVFSAADAEDLHNLVYRSDWSLVPEALHEP
ncbi:hypothetical protein [Motilibacter deserti]|uniref:Uncharacterized protein n=1 Tax=Motilibacter deserti TaxID=2714956 RepID=A0ABX0GT33_9ACTN|nr:hypothetical protein [Motilibacter deserti]NHC12498.1 hypothetical protein [Motilibacter deserti]